MTDTQTTRIEHFNNAYRSRLNDGIFVGVIGAMSLYLDVTRNDKKSDLQTQAKIVPFFNWNSNNGDRGVTIRSYLYRDTRYKISGVTNN